MDRRMQIVVAALAALEVVLLGVWVTALVTSHAAGATRPLGVVLFLAATATVIAAVAVVAARGRRHGRVRR